MNATTAMPAITEMTPAPRFSIITCTLDSLPWLDACIASVMKQRDVTYEMVFVDGGSTDGSLERIAALAKVAKVANGRCQLTVLRDVRGGIARAMNAGLAAARGDIVAHLHSDDFYLHDEVLATVSHAFNTSGCRWLFGRTLRAHGAHSASGAPDETGKAGETGETVERLEPEGWQAPPYSRAQLLRGNFIPHPATFVERQLMLDAGGFNTHWRYAMDYDLWLRLARMAEPLQLAQPLAAFREHAGSLSTRERQQAMREDLRVRLSHAGPNPVARLAHVARHVARHVLRPAVRDALQHRRAPSKPEGGLHA